MSVIVVITNDGTGDETFGHYDYTISINRKRIASGRVESFVRACGAPALIRCVAEAEGE